LNSGQLLFVAGHCQEKAGQMSLQDQTPAKRRGTGPRPRAQRPERIPIGDDELVRQDILAQELGQSERSMNRGDKDGAPYRSIAGVKYRPNKRYRQFLADTIQRHGQEPKRRKR
jgi:hypothetical protein